MSERIGSRLSARLRGAVAALLAVVSTMTMVASAAGQQRPVFRTTVEVVQMQVSVADARGYHISGLTRDDFLLRVNGEAREITAAYEIDLRPTPNPDLEVADSVPVAGWRQFLLFFDFSFSTKRGIMRARDAAMEFVKEHTHPRDLISVATYSTAGGLELVSPFTADRAQVLNAISGFGLNRAGYIVDQAGFAVQSLADALEAERGTTRTEGQTANTQRQQLEVLLDENLFSNTMIGFQTDFRRYREEVVNYADQLVQLGELLTATHGRKHVLLFSSGFDDKVLAGQSLEELAEDTQLLENGQAWAINYEQRFGSADLRDSLQEAVDNLRAADAVFHVFDTSGLGGKVDDTFSTTASGKQGLSYLADGTNGSITWNSNDLLPALVDLSERTARYYVIAYRKHRDDPSTVDIDVDMVRPGLKVVGAPTRLAPPPAYAQMNQTQRQLQLSEFISKGIEREDMTFDVRAIPFAGTSRINRVAVVVEVPFQQLESIAKTRGDGAVEIDILGYIMDDNGQMRDLFSRRVKLDIERMTETMAGLPFRYYDLLWAPRGEHQVRVLVRDTEVGMLSTRTERIVVPRFAALDAVTISGPIAIDTAHPGLLMRGLDPQAPPKHREGGPVAYPFVVDGRELTPQVYTLARAGGTCSFMLVAHNLARHPFTGRVQTALNATAIDELGQVHEVPGITLLASDYDAATNTTRLWFEAALPDDLVEGAYLMQIDLVDAIAGQTIEKVVPFLITGATDD